MKVLATISLTTLALAGLAACSSPQTSVPKSSTQTAEDNAEDSADAVTTGPKAVARQVENITIAPGSDPMAMVFSNREGVTEPSSSEQIRLTYPTKNKAIVTVTKTELKDDSISASRRRYEFKADKGADKPQWQLVQVTEQNKCQPGRGAQDWTGALCQ